MLSNKNSFKDKKVFLIINSYYIGDILLANPLVQNIKQIYEDAHVVMLTPPSMVDVAKYQEGVDDVVVWDRSGVHHGCYNMLKFVWNFPYKNIYASFPIYSGDRAIMLAFLLRSKYILGQYRNIIGTLLKSKYKVNKIFDDVPGSNINFLSGITKSELHNYPIKLSLPNVNTDLLNSINEEFVCLCPTSSRIEKDMTKEDVCEIIENIKCKIVLLGRGESSKQLSDFVKGKNYDNLIDLSNKTSFLELAYVMNSSTGCISVDTGTLHLASALNKRTVGVFYKKLNWGYRPDSSTYPNVFCGSDLRPNEIIKIFNDLQKK